MMSSRKQRPPQKGNVVKGRFRKQNPVDEEKTAGINVKQVVWIGALTALTGTIVGAVASEVYRHLRPKVPLPMPQQPGQPVAQNPYGYGALPPGWAPPQPTWTPNAGQFVPNPGQFVPGVVQQVGAFPQPQVPAPSYFSAPAIPMGTFAPNPALPPAQQVPVVPQAPAGDPEPLSRPELAQWQRRLEGWERDLERRDHRE